MKTIRYYRPFGGHVERVTDVVAAQAVSEGRAMYVPKHWYKAAKKREEE